MCKREWAPLDSSRWSVEIGFLARHLLFPPPIEPPLCFTLFPALEADLRGLDEWASLSSDLRLNLVNGVPSHETQRGRRENGRFYSSRSLPDYSLGADYSLGLKVTASFKVALSTRLSPS